MNIFNSDSGRLIGAALCLGASAVVPSWAQAAPAPDVLLLVDGEKLIGHFESADASTVVFKSDLAGEVKIDWSKIKDLITAEKFAVAQKGETYGKNDNPAKVPQGTIAVTDAKVTVTPDSGAPISIPVANTQNIIPQATFMNAFKHPRLVDYWTGSASAGFALVDSTQTSKSVTTAMSLVRTVPADSWISPRYRTTVDFNSAYGTSTSDGLTIKTNIIHASLEQDEYLSKRMFLFGDAGFDHNYSQGLDLQYTLGGGVGFVAYKDARQELDLKGQAAYINQIFTFGSSTHLIGAILGETYNHNFIKNITFHQELSITPAFNQPDAYTANGLMNLGVPITKKIDFTVGLIDSFLNNPPVGFKKNSFQITTNLTYNLK